MGEAFESIMRGLAEVKANREGRHPLKTTTVDASPTTRALELGTILRTCMYNLVRTMLSYL
jgi:hypothetical protein